MEPADATDGNIGSGALFASWTRLFRDAEGLGGTDALARIIEGDLNSGLGFAPPKLSELECALREAGRAGFGGGVGLKDGDALTSSSLSFPRCLVHG